MPWKYQYYTIIVALLSIIHNTILPSGICGVGRVENRNHFKNPKYPDFSYNGKLESENTLKETKWMEIQPEPVPQTGHSILEILSWNIGWQNGNGNRIRICHIAGQHSVRKYSVAQYFTALSISIAGNPSNTFWVKGKNNVFGFGIKDQISWVFSSGWETGDQILKVFSPVSLVSPVPGWNITVLYTTLQYNTIQCTTA